MPAVAPAVGALIVLAGEMLLDTTHPGHPQEQGVSRDLLLDLVTDVRVGAHVGHRRNRVSRFFHKVRIEPIPRVGVDGVNHGFRPSHEGCALAARTR